jgi:hypothetical protein
VVRDLEDKLRERELELQQLRDNLDENEAAICQVSAGAAGFRGPPGALEEVGLLVRQSLSGPHFI